MSAEATVQEAAKLTRKLIQHEMGKCGDKFDTAVYRTAALWGFEEGSLRTLWKRPQVLKKVAGHLLDKLRHIDAIIETTAKRRAEELEQTAQTLERVGHPAAALARMAAEKARIED